MTSKDDLKEKVSEIFDSLKEFGMYKLDKLILSGSDVIKDHELNQCNYVTPKDFLVAFAKEIEHQYGRPNPTRTSHKIIKNYYNLM
jgi:hypothetical protein